MRTLRHCRRDYRKLKSRESSSSREKTLREQRRNALKTHCFDLDLIINKLNE